MADSNKSVEGNFGLGSRHLYSKHIIGGYAFYDIRNTSNSNKISQLTVGTECLTGDYEFRINGYFPERATKKIKSTATISTAQSTGSNVISTFIRDVKTEIPLTGFDMEVGGNIFGYDKITTFLAYYNMYGKELKHAMHGLRIRGAYAINQYISIDAEYDYDNYRKNRYFVGLNLSWSPDFKKNNRSKLVTKMTQPIVRDIDIVAAETSYEEKMHAEELADFQGKTTRDYIEEVVQHFIDNPDELEDHISRCGDYQDECIILATIKEHGTSTTFDQISTIITNQTDEYSEAIFHSEIGATRDSIRSKMVALLEDRQIKITDEVASEIKASKDPALTVEQRAIHAKNAETKTKKLAANTETFAAVARLAMDALASHASTRSGDDVFANISDASWEQEEKSEQEELSEEVIVRAATAFLNIGKVKSSKGATNDVQKNVAARKSTIVAKALKTVRKIRFTSGNKDGEVGDSGDDETNYGEFVSKSGTTRRKARPNQKTMKDFYRTYGDGAHVKKMSEMEESFDTYVQGILDGGGQKQLTSSGLAAIFSDDDVRKERFIELLKDKNFIGKIFKKCQKVDKWNGVTYTVFDRAQYNKYFESTLGGLKVTDFLAKPTASQSKRTPADAAYDKFRSKKVKKMRSRVIDLQMVSLREFCKYYPSAFDADTTFNAIMPTIIQEPTGTSVVH